MQTSFTATQRTDAAIREAEGILRTCVHCGFCLATCPTYVLLGDERDSPRGRIYLIKDMLESGGPAPASIVRHVDRCLSCLGCMTTCPSGVDYVHLVDHARAHVQETHQRTLGDRLLREILARVLPRPNLFRAALFGATLARPFARVLPGRLKGMVRMAPKKMPAPSFVDRPQVFPAGGERRKRVALMTGCAQQVLAPAINEATVRLLARHGCEVVVAKGAGCCGALVHHMGREDEARAQARANVAAWRRELDGAGLDAIIINASGCGTTVKDYGYMLAGDQEFAADAERISGLTRDVTEFMLELGLQGTVESKRLRVAYHSACSMQHGQQITEPPRALLRAAGFEVLEVPEAHLCCGSAGTYNLLQPELAARLGTRKVLSIESVEPDIVAAGNIGCMVQIGAGTEVPVAHTVELLDWATGGPAPAALANVPR